MQEIRINLFFAADRFLSGEKQTARPSDKEGGASNTDGHLPTVLLSNEIIQRNVEELQRAAKPQPYPLIFCHAESFTLRDFWLVLFTQGHGLVQPQRWPQPLRVPDSTRSVTSRKL